MMTAKQIITSAKQMTGFYMKHDTGLKWVSAGYSIKVISTQDSFPIMSLVGGLNLFCN